MARGPKGSQASKASSRPPQGGPSEKRICAGTKRDGSPCNASATPGDKWCWNHDPAHAETRRLNASRAGKTKPASLDAMKLKDLDGKLATLYDATWGGEVETRVAAVLNQIIQSRTKLVEVE